MAKKWLEHQVSGVNWTSSKKRLVIRDSQMNRVSWAGLKHEIVGPIGAQHAHTIARLGWHDPSARVVLGSTPWSSVSTWHWHTERLTCCVWVSTWPTDLHGTT